MAFRKLILAVPLLLAFALGLYAAPKPQVRRLDTYPWLIEANCNLNVRAGMDTGTELLGTIPQGTRMTAYDQASSHWIEIKYKGRKAYVYSPNITFVRQMTLGEVFGTPSRPSSSSKKASEASRPPRKKPSYGFWGTMYEITKLILIICAILIVIGGILHTELGSPAVLLQIISGIGALIGGIFFGNARIGASIGMMAGVGLAIVYVVHLMDFSGIGRLTLALWYLISLPFYLLDLLQFWLSKPWRPFMKKNTLPDSSKPGMRKFLGFMQIPFYIICFPLRLLNAVYYNMIIHNVYEFSNYVLEVFVPSDEHEGKGSLGIWITALPFRILKYIVFHFSVTLLESAIWTLIDTFIPAVTLFHGTAQEFADNMLSDPLRTESRKKASDRKTGLWNVGDRNFAGDGIYFGIFRSTLRNYEKGSAIAARVTLGKTIDTVLMPDWVYNQAGRQNASEVSKWGLRHGYVTGEWWRSDGRWWEMCLYDRKNKYNEMWRIRPIYAISTGTGIMQRIPTGTAHWLFRGMVLGDIAYTFRRLFGKK